MVSIQWGEDNNYTAPCRPPDDPMDTCEYFHNGTKYLAELDPENDNKFLKVFINLGLGVVTRLLAFVITMLSLH